MSGDISKARSTAEIVADLREFRVLGGCDCGECLAPVHEAADRLETLQALLTMLPTPTGERTAGVPPWQAGRLLTRVFP